MSDQTQENIELFDNDQPEVFAETGTDTTSEQTLGNDLSQAESKEAIREANAQAQAKVWADRIAKGEELPESLKWLLPRIQELKPVKHEDTESIIERKLAEKESQKRFQELKSELNELNLSKSQQVSVTNELNTLIKEFKMPADKALEYAIAKVGINLQEAKLKELKNSMSIPTGGKVREEIDVMKMAEKDRLKVYMETLRSNQ